MPFVRSCHSKSKENVDKLPWAIGFQMLSQEMLDMQELLTLTTLLIYGINVMDFIIFPCK